MKRLKVTALPGGRLVPYRREGALPPTTDEWWQNVLHDPRATFRNVDTRIASDSPQAFYRLDRQHGASILINCACGRNGVFNKAQLIEHLGGDANVNWLARKLLEDTRQRER